MKIYDFDEEVLRPYFQSENVINGVFKVANKLYGLDFTELADIDKFHDDVKVYEVKDISGKYIGLLYEDIYPRSTKRGGAWMNQLKSQCIVDGVHQHPHVTFNCNLTKSTANKPALLSLSEVRTIFHEFGHCLLPNVYSEFMNLDILLPDVYCIVTNPQFFFISPTRWVF